MMKFSFLSTANPAAGNSHNEDAFAVKAEVLQGEHVADGVLESDSRSLFAVSDGIHVSPTAALASRTVLKLLQAIFDEAPDLHPGRKVTALHEGFCAEIRSARDPHFGMTATLVAAEFEGTKVHIYHVGDSRAWRVSVGSAEQLTKDHTLAQSMVDSGEAAIDFVDRASRGYGGIDEYFCADPYERRPRHSYRTVGMRPDEVLLLCSDGISNLEDNRHALLAGESITDYVARLAKEAIDAGSDDNITVLAIQPVPTT